MREHNASNCASLAVQFGINVVSMNESWKQRISINPSICKGRACVAGARVMVSVVLDNLAAGETAADIAKAYPPVTTEDVHACMAYAAELAHEEIVPLEPAAA